MVATPKSRALPFVLVLAVAACDEPSSSTGDAPFSAQDALETSPSAPRSVTGPTQVTVLDEDQLDPLDPTELHVAVPAGGEVVAFARAVDLLAAADPTALPQPAMAATLAAQQLAADLAHADGVGVASVTAVTPRLAPDGSATDLLEVTFAVGTTLSGPTVGSFITALPQDTRCGPSAPAVGDERLVFLDIDPTGGAWLRIDAPLVPVVSGQVALHGLHLSVTDIATVIQQNPETT
ncbi:hypothetical protein [Paraliomyxa miuraensis]|uniref:hypothetical protein n=1 Tax=Paraliomyxa miuraensis TaxID=376150 RepID=UPI00225956EB|nr:hypothetical protein [Paraliomyxa miuraensis]MCX4242747.1 hypothetical protein [Paraliomyxa miuraensis]